MSNKKMKLISALFLIIGLLFPVGFLLDFISEKVAFPIMFTCIGCQQLFNGLILNLKNKPLKLVSISIGILVIIFAIFKVIPRYYFK